MKFEFCHRRRIVFVLLNKSRICDEHIAGLYDDELCLFEGRSYSSTQTV